MKTTAKILDSSAWLETRWTHAEAAGNWADEFMASARKCCIFRI